MAITYDVIFEKKKDKFRIAGVANNPVDRNKIAGSVSSKGFEYSSVITDYTCNTPLNNDFFTVYIKAKKEDEDEKEVFSEMVLDKDHKYPNNDDLYIYKLEKSAVDRMDKINDSFTEEELKVKEAVVVPTKINTVY